MMHRREHRSRQGLLAIVNIRASINLGLSDDLAKAFPDTKPVLRPIIEDKDRIIKHPEWVAGFTTGEGTFFISVNKNRNKVGVGFRTLLHKLVLFLINLCLGLFKKCWYFKYLNSKPPR